jgi:predicted Zn-dependent peptidase
MVLGYDVLVDPSSDDYYKVMVYNAILGGYVNSKMFQNVREKESLAYTARSMYIKHKAILLITAGIEIEKYEKGL